MYSFETLKKEYNKMKDSYIYLQYIFRKDFLICSKEKKSTNYLLFTDTHTCINSHSATKK